MLSRILLFLLSFAFLSNSSSASLVKNKFYDKKSGLVLFFPSKINMIKSNSDSCAPCSEDFKLIPGRTIGCFYYKGDYFDLYLDVSVSTSPDILRTCLNDGKTPKYMLNLARGSVKKIYIDGKPFMHISSGEGAAGNVYDSDIYRGIVNNQCFSFYLLNHYADGVQFEDNNQNQVEMFFNN